MEDGDLAAPAAPSFPPPPANKPASKRSKATAKEAWDAVGSPSGRDVLAPIAGGAANAPAEEEASAAGDKGGRKRRLHMPGAAADLDAVQEVS